MLTLGVHCTSESAKMPTRSTERAQCIDFYAAEDAVIYAGQTVVIDLGVKVVIPEGYGLEFRERSGLASKGIIIGAGIIDEDYHGPLKAVVRYMSHVPPSDGNLVPGIPSVSIAAGTKIVQAELVKRIPVDIRKLSATQIELAIEHSERGEKGFGSSDER